MPGEVTKCQACGHPDLIPLLDMGRQPLAEGMTSRAYPLALIKCLRCNLVQLSYVVDQNEVFTAGHPYSTGNSVALREHYWPLVWGLQGNLLIDDVVADIGANDGTLLSFYNSNLRRIAVEPTDQVLRCAGGIVRVQEFFTWAVAHELHAQYGPAKVITACNVLAHVPDVHNFLDGVTEWLAEDGVFVTENHDLASITDGLQVDTVYHEHLRYYTPGTLSILLEEHGLRVTRVEQVPTHGGSFRVTARLSPLTDFAERARNAAYDLHKLLWDKLTSTGDAVVYGIGAATRATPLIHYADIANAVAVCCEVAGSDKIGTLIPGTQIPVVDEAVLIEDQPAYALLFAWHMADVIVPKLRAAGYKGKFIVPLPEPKVLDD